MPNWKKVAISGSNISQFNNDGIYTKMSGSTANGLLTYHSAETASVESRITYNGSTQTLLNHGKILAFSGSAFTTSNPPSSNGALSAFKSPHECAWTPLSGSRSHTISAITRYPNFGSGGVCTATIGITAQKGTGDKNATVELTSIAKQDGCHDAIFSIGVKCDGGSGVTVHPIEERFRIDGKTAKVTISGSLLVKPSYVAASSSLDNILVYDNNTGEIKKSTLTPPTSNAVTSVNGQTGVVTVDVPVDSVNGATGAVTLAQITNGSGIVSGSAGNAGNVQYNSGTSCGFAAENSFTYDASTDKLTVKNPGNGTGGLITNNIEGGGDNLIISDGGNDKKILLETGDGDICMSAWGQEKVVIVDGQTTLCGNIFTPDLTSTAETDCPSVVISSTGELLEGPVGGAGASTLQEVTTEGNTTNNPIIFNATITNCIKVADVGQSGCSKLFIQGSSNSSGTGGCGGDIEITAGDSTSTGGGNGGSILLNAGIAANPGAAKGCVQVNCSVGLKVANGSLTVGNISLSATTGRIDASNDIVAYSTSDCRLKKYIKPIQNALDKIDQIRGVEFDWKVTDEKMEEEVHSFKGHDVGVIAQEIEAVLPEVVTTRDSGYKAVKYEKIVPLLIQGIKELKSEVEILKSKI